MTVPSTIRKAGPYNGNDVATSFAFAFKVFTSADIAVTMADVDGAETLLVLDSGYSVTLNGDQDASPGGSITYPMSGTPLATGEALVIVGDLDYGQDLDVPTGGDFNPAALEDALDKQAMRTQQLLEINERSLTLAVTSDAGVSTSLPVPEAGGFLGWNAAANALINYAGVAGVAVSSFMEGVVAAVNGAAARTALGFTAVGDAVAIAVNAAAARTAIGGAASGANNDITSLSAPALGAATATTAAPGTNTTQVATTAFVLANNVPAGTIIDFAGTTAPSGYLACPLTATNISRTTYATLFAAISTTWGAGDGSTTFGCPWFPANYAAVQANANVGTATVGENLAHTHTASDGGGFQTTTAGPSYGSTGAGSNQTATTSSNGGSANLAAGHRVLKCVKL